MTDGGPDLFADSDLEEPVVAVVRRMAVEGFQAIWAGREVAVDDLVVGDSGLRAAALGHLLERGRIEVTDDGRLVAIHGLSTRATRHRIEHAEGVVHTWCALDAIGIPAALRVDARAVTDCPTCRAALEVVLVAGSPRSGPEARLWFPERCGPHLLEGFCSAANLFCSGDHLEEWADGRAGTGRVLTVEEVAEQGRIGWAAVAG